VQGVLRLEFAKTVTLGVSIAEMATPMLTRICLPFAVHVVPKPYHHWIPLLIKSTARAIGVALAWRIQVVLSAVHLAMRGGLLFSRSMMRWARHRRLTTLHEDSTSLDEVVGCAVAACGFWFQLECGFALPFPLNVVLFPFTVSADWSRAVDLVLCAALSAQRRASPSWLLRSPPPPQSRPTLCMRLPGPSRRQRPTCPSRTLCRRRQWSGTSVTRSLRPPRPREGTAPSGDVSSGFGRPKHEAPTLSRVPRHITGMIEQHPRTLWTTEQGARGPPSLMGWTNG